MALEDGRPISDVLKDIVGNLTEIIRTEIRLARFEIRDEASRVWRAALFIVLGTIFGILACGLLLWGGIYMLAQVIALWAAILIVTALTATFGGVLLTLGRAQLKRVALPPKTIASLREDVRWAKQNS